MNINLENRLYKIDNQVYFGYTRLNVHNQRGRLFIKRNGRQTNIKDIPVLPGGEEDHVLNYVFNGGFQTHPCPATEFWIYRHRLGNKISITDFKRKYNVERRKKLSVS